MEENIHSDEIVTIGTTTGWGNGFFEADVGQDGIVLENVVLKEDHVFYQFLLRNLSNEEIKIRFYSELGGKIGFQLENANFQSDVAEFEYGVPYQPDYFNQIFNDIGLIDEINLAPRQSQKIILSFRPRYNLSQETNNEISDDEDEIISQTRDKRNSYSEIRSSISLFGSSLTDQIQSELRIPFVVRMCRSLLKVGEQELRFENCSLGGVHVRDFSLWNASEMPLKFAIYCQENKKGGVLEFSDSETGLLISSMEHVIPGFYHASIRVTYKPTELGKFHIKATIENRNDKENKEEIMIHAIVTAKEDIKKDLLIVDDSINFGDCYTGISTYQLLKLKNMSGSSLDIHFKSDLPSEVSFDIHTEKEDDSQDLSVAKTNLQISNLPFDSLRTKKELTKSLQPGSPNRKDIDDEKQTNDKSLTRIEELRIYPGAERIVRVQYTPSRLDDIDSKAAKFHRRKFTIFLKIIDERQDLIVQKKKIQSKARVCTSIIQIPTKQILMGDCDISTSKLGIVEIINISDLPAVIAIQYESKAVRFKKKNITIPPKEEAKVLFDFNPQKPSSDYKKQITFVNLNNKNNDQFVEIKANIIDRLKSASHSQYYRIVTNSRDCIDFGNVIVNSPTVCSFIIKNITNSELSFHLRTLSPDEIQLYVENIYNSKMTPTTTPKRRETLMKSIEDSQNNSERNIRNSSQLNKGLDLATLSRSFIDRPLEGTPKTSKDSETPESIESKQYLHEKFQTSLEILNRVCHSPQLIPLFTDSRQEDEYIMQEVSRLSLAKRAIKEQILLSIESLEMQPLEQKTIYAVFHPIGTKRPSVKGKLKKFDSKILLHLERVGKIVQEIEAQELRVTAKICRSIINLAQKNVNFGDMMQDDHKSKILLVSNLSEVPLLFQIRKTGSMTSLDLKISEEDRMGVIRPYRKREIHFFFKPTLNQIYDEKIIIENIYDQTDNQIVEVKANVLKPRNFFIKSLDLDFGTCLLGEESVAKTIFITNTSKKRKTFYVDVDKHRFEYCYPDVIFSLEEEQKSDNKKNRGSDIFSVSIEPKEMQKIRAILIAHPQIDSDQEQLGTVTCEEGKGVILVYEGNREIAKKISFTALICFDKETFRQKFQSSGNTIPEIKIQDNKSIRFSDPESLEGLHKKDPLEILEEKIDLGEFPISTPMASKFTISNSSFQLIEFGIMVRTHSQEQNQIEEWISTPISNTHPIFEFSETKGFLASKSRRIIQFTCKPTYAGSQKHTIYVRNNNTGRTKSLFVYLTPTHPVYIMFPDLNKSKTDILDLGICYINEKQSNFSQPRSLRIQSLVKDDIYISVTSNMSNQVLVFQDKALTTPASSNDQDFPENSILLKGKSTCTVYVCVRPNMEKKEYEKGKCRTLSGGIRVKIHDKKRNLGNVFLKFKAIIGKSILQVTPNIINLGCSTQQNRVYQGKFELSNQNTLLPLRYTIDTTKAKNTKLSRTFGKLDGCEDLRGNSKAEIHYTFTTNSYGLWRETIEIKNEEADEIQTLILRVFVDEGILASNLPKDELNFEEILLLDIPNPDLDKDFFQISPSSYTQLLKTFSLQNLSNQSVVLYPKSDLNVLVTWETFDEKNLQNQKSINQPHLCGKPFSIRSKQIVSVFVYLRFLSSIVVQTSDVLKKTNFSGELYFEREIEEMTDLEEESLMRVSKPISVIGFFSVSRGEITPSYFELGKIGYENGWEAVIIAFNFKNLSEVNLVVKPENLPNFVSLLEDSSSDQESASIVVRPLQSRIIQAKIFPSKIKSFGSFEHELLFVNTNNPNNKIPLQIKGELTPCSLDFSTKQLKLPPLLHPSSVHAFNTFIVKNFGPKPLEMFFSSESSDDITKYVIVEILGRQSRCSLESFFSLASGESIEVQVNLKPKDDTRLPLRQEDIPISGKIVAIDKSLRPVESITWNGSLIPGETFLLSTNELIFDIQNQNDHTVNTSFSITNLLSGLPLEYQVSQSNNNSFTSKLNIIVEPSKGSINPKQKQEIQVSLHFQSLNELYSESIGLIVNDINSATTKPLTIKFLEKGTMIHKATMENLNSQNTASLPVIELKGCTPIPNEDFQYEINIGNQNQHATITWDLELETNSELLTPLEYKINTVDKDDKNWLTFSKTRGFLSKSKEKHIIQLSFNTKKMDSYSTFIVVENCSNPGDLKFIRVSIKVIATQNTHFSVFVGGKSSPNPVIDFGDVYYNHSYKERSIVISNDSNMPLDFLLSSNLPPESLDEVNFSLSRTSLNLFNFITIGANSSVRVFLHFRAYLPESAPPEEDLFIDKMIEIYISCTLIKDYQHVIRLKARYCHPQISLSTLGLTFQGSVNWRKDSITQQISWKETDIQFTPQELSKEIYVRNTFNFPLSYVIQNDSVYFLVEAAKHAVITSKYVSHSISIKPNITSILNNRKVLLKEKYIEEHLTIYNKNRLSERWPISLRLSFGQIRYFYSAPGIKLTHPLNILESSITHYLREFVTFWNAILDQVKKRTNKKEITLFDVDDNLIKTINESDIYFTYQYITDELVHFGLKKQTGRFAFKLADLFFTTTFKQETFSTLFTGKSPLPSGMKSIILQWLDRLSFFLSFFPDPSISLANLRSLEQELLESTQTIRKEL